jgi:cell division protein FtsB
LNAGFLRLSPGRREHGAKGGLRRGRAYARLFSGESAAVRRCLVALMVVLLALLQYRFWLGDGGIHEIWRLKYKIAQQARENDALRERNEGLDAEVMDLKQGAAAIEERARSELGMVRRDETFYQTFR